MSSVLARVDADRQMIATETGLHLRMWQDRASWS
jgi:hypothetical protein